MPIKLKVRKVGNSLGVVLPKEALAELKVEEGQSLYLTRTEEGHLVTAANDEFEKQMAVAKDIMHRYRNALRELAK